MYIFTLNLLFDSIPIHEQNHVLKMCTEISADQSSSLGFELNTLFKYFSLLINKSNTLCTAEGSFQRASSVLKGGCSVI